MSLLWPCVCVCINSEEAEEELTCEMCLWALLIYIINISTSMQLLHVIYCCCYFVVGMKSVSMEIGNIQTGYS